MTTDTPEALARRALWAAIRATIEEFYRYPLSLSVAKSLMDLVNHAEGLRPGEIRPLFRRFLREETPFARNNRWEPNSWGFWPRVWGPWLKAQERGLPESSEEVNA